MNRFQLRRLYASSYFEECPRNEQGWCLPGGGEGEKAPAEQSAPRDRDKEALTRQAESIAKTFADVDREMAEKGRRVSDVVRGLPDGTVLFKGYGTRYEKRSIPGEEHPFVVRIGRNGREDWEPASKSAEAAGYVRRMEMSPPTEQKAPEFIKHGHEIVDDRIRKLDDLMKEKGQEVGAARQRRDFAKADNGEVEYDSLKEEQSVLKKSQMVSGYESFDRLEGLLGKLNGLIEGNTSPDSVAALGAAKSHVEWYFSKLRR